MNNSGIASLAGYAYQIKVFIYCLATLQENYTIGYETYDDIALKKSDKEKDKQENKLHVYNGLLDSPSGITALQIKHTHLSNEDYEKVLFNWILLKNEYPNIEKYILFIDKKYKNIDAVFPDDLKLLYDKITSSKKTNAALITKVKNIINGNYTLFYNLCNEIKNKYIFQEISDIDAEILEGYKSIFNHGGVMDAIYQLRIEELVQKIEYEILRSVIENNSYSCDYHKFKHIVEDIITCIRDDSYLPPSFSDFKKASKLDITNTDIIRSREYLQLSKCNLPENLIKEHLIFEEYYNSYKLRNLENIKTNVIQDIENTTHYNFEITKLTLSTRGQDIPLNRLTETLSKDNSHTSNNQIRYGSAIHLTKADTEKNLLISWEDD
ncbi:MAG: hypothetical protein J6N52_02215 [Clostridia bacterium]|nr:hypothetical protein [Clostridia bacterium]